MPLILRSYIVPIYKYQCYECGLEFEEIRPANKREECPCPSCSELAQKLVSAGNFTFKHNPTGIHPQNTGVASIDYDFDKTIGRDSEQKWRKIEDRRAEKIKHLEDEIKSGKNVGMEHLTPNADGGFRTLTGSEIKETNAKRSLAQDFNKGLYQAHRKEDSKKET